jgi:ABC-type branched-subunit amino acid transport system substrate-binding protein
MGRRVVGLSLAAVIGAASSAGATTVPDAGGDSFADVVTGRGVSDDTIKMAVLNGFTGPIANLAIPAADGMDAYLNMVNEAGGVCGRQLVSDRVDTQYDPQVAIQEYRAIHDEVALVGVVGGAAIFGLSEDIERDNMTLLANTGLEAVLPLRNVMIFIAPFALEVINGLTWASEELAGDDGVLQLGVVYQADAFGESGLAAAQYVADNTDNVEIVGSASYAAADQDLSAQAQAMADSGAEVVWTAAISSQIPKLLGAADQIGYSPTWIGGSPSFTSSYVAELGDLLENFRFVTSVVSFGEDVPGMADLVENYGIVAPDAPGEDYAVLGWLQGAVAAQLLQRACDLGDLSPEGILAAQDGLEIDTAGIASSNFTYGTSVEDRIPTRAVRVDSVNLETAAGEPLTDFFVSPLAEEWTLEATAG